MYSWFQNDVKIANNETFISRVSGNQEADGNSPVILFQQYNKLKREKILIKSKSLAGEIEKFYPRPHGLAVYHSETEK